MKKFLLGLSALLICTVVQAQTADGLFPELRKKAVADAEKEASDQRLERARSMGLISEENNPQLFKEEVNDEEPVNRPQAQPVIQEQLSERLSKAAQTQKDKEKKLSGNFEISPHNLKIVVPVVESMQFCTGQLSLQNGTEYNLQSLQVYLKYGPIDMPYAFPAVKSGENITGTINMAGPACQELLKSVAVTVDSCVATGLAEADCKAKVKYILK